MKISIIGSGSWGTAIASLLAKKGNDISLWSRTEETVKSINENHFNPKYLKNIRLPEKIIATNDIEKSITWAEIIIFAVPAHAMRNTISMIKPYLKSDVPLVSLIKGLEVDSLNRISEIIIQSAGDKFKNNFAVLSGPNHAEEVVAEIPSATVISAFDMSVASKLQGVFMSPHLRVYTNSDINGVELGGVTKNVVAIAAGISDGLGFGDNTKAALLTRGLAEMTRLGVVRGAKEQTFSGLSGLGDLIATSTSQHSRNRSLGEALGNGKTLKEFKETSSMVAEGSFSCLALKEISAKEGIEMPINNAVVDVLYNNKSPLECVQDLMNRGPKTEN